MLLFLSELFVFGGIGFWLVVAAFCILMSILVETEKAGWATIMFVLTTWFLCAINGISIFKEVVNNPGEVAGMFAGYVGVGVGWSMVKWWRFVVSRLDKYRAMKEEFLTKYNHRDSKEITEDLKEDWKHFLDHNTEALRNGYWENLGKVPNPARYKGKLIAWMAYWPWSVAWTMLDDPIRRLFNSLFTHMVSTYEGIAKRVFKEVEKDLA